MFVKPNGNHSVFTQEKVPQKAVQHFHKNVIPPGQTI